MFENTAFIILVCYSSLVTGMLIGIMFYSEDLEEK
jgi:hypothetical protein